MNVDLSKKQPSNNIEEERERINWRQWWGQAIGWFIVALSVLGWTTMAVAMTDHDPWPGKGRPTSNIARCEMKGMLVGDSGDVLQTVRKIATDPALLDLSMPQARLIRDQAALETVAGWKVKPTNTVEVTICREPELKLVVVNVH